MNSKASAVKRGRGRPCKPGALTPAQRSAAYRARRAALAASSPSPALVQGLVDAPELVRAYQRGVDAGRDEITRDVTALFDHMRLMRLRQKKLTVDQLVDWFSARSA